MAALLLLAWHSGTGEAAKGCWCRPARFLFLLSCVSFLPTCNELHMHAEGALPCGGAEFAHGAYSKTVSGLQRRRLASQPSSTKNVELKLQSAAPVDGANESGSHSSSGGSGGTYPSPVPPGDRNHGAALEGSPLGSKFSSPFMYAYHPTEVKALILGRREKRAARHTHTAATPSDMTAAVSRSSSRADGPSSAGDLASPSACEGASGPLPQNLRSLQLTELRDALAGTRALHNTVLSKMRVRQLIKRKKGTDLRIFTLEKTLKCSLERYLAQLLRDVRNLKQRAEPARARGNSNPQWTTPESGESPRDAPHGDADTDSDSDKE